MILSQTIQGLHGYIYKEWSALAEVQEIEKSFPECGECDGEGSHVCDCGDEHDCGSCNGTGKQENLRDMYQKQLRSDLEALLLWRDGLPKTIKKKV